MIDLRQIDYSALDRLELSRYLFYPRPDTGPATPEDVVIPVEGDIRIGARFYISAKTAPNLLFFHGNGEIATDYEDLAPLFAGAGLNFLPVDYRGYGRSTGTPSITAMMRDCHMIYEFVRERLGKEGCSGPLIVMGRSLGSASALELLASYGDKIDAAVIESGFAHTRTLMNLLGLNLKDFGLTEEDGFRNLDKVRTFGKPILIIHAEYDHILPFEEGRALYEASPSPDKKFLKIPGANHNDIFARGMKEYLEALKELVKKI
jgi:pimeloyl-ACP methyl ester carboxylesterase